MDVTVWDIFAMILDIQITFQMTHRKINIISGEESKQALSKLKDCEGVGLLLLYVFLLWIIT